jgi:tetratricopeptide (TPR) repeat protein
MRRRSPTSADTWTGCHLPERQHTLRSTLAWGHDLLGPGEQRLFRRLAVFTGPWTLDAVEAVCADRDSPAQDVLDQLGALINNSLVQPAVGEQEPRFSMLETIREYALEELEAAGEVEALRRRHLDWCLTLVQPMSLEPPDPRPIGRLSAEHDNLRAALRWAIDRRLVEDGLRLGAALWMSWYLRGAYTEGRSWLSELLNLPGVESAPFARAHALAAAGHLAYCQGEYSTAERLLVDARAHAEVLGHELLVSVAVHLLGNVARWRGDLPQAQCLYQSALAGFRRLGHQMWQALALSLLATVLCERGDDARAAECAQAGLALFEAAGNKWGMCTALYGLGRVGVRRGDRTHAVAVQQAALALNRELGDPQGTALCLVALGDDALTRGDSGAARRCFTESLMLAERVGDRMGMAWSLDGLASLVASEEPTRAVRLGGAADALPAEPARSEHARGTLPPARVAKRCAPNAGQTSVLDRLERRPRPACAACRGGGLAGRHAEAGQLAALTDSPAAGYRSDLCVGWNIELVQDAVGEDLFADLTVQAVLHEVRVWT